MRKSRSGFSLIELLIVVAIILIIAAVAVPNLIRSRMAANEASAVASLRALTTAYLVYSSTYGNGFPPDLTSLRTPPPATLPDCGANGSGLVDNVFSGQTTGGTPTTFTKSGYTFVYTGANQLPSAPVGMGCTAPGYGASTTSAVPLIIGATGQRGFLIDSSGVIYYDASGGVPTTSSPIL